MNLIPYKRILINTFLLFCHKISLYRIFNPFYAGIGSILMLHRVVDKKDYTKIGIDGLEISREFLESLIQYFLSNNYEIVSIDNVYDILKGGRPLEKRFVHFTFDDGFRDNYTIVYPVFK